MTRTTLTMFAILLTAGLTGCEEATGPEGTGTVQVGIRGDDGAASSSAAPEPEQTESSRAQGQQSGSVEVQARVFVRAEGGGWTEVTDGAARQTVTVEGKEGLRVLATSRLEARSYDRVRVQFGSVRASGLIGLQIGTGVLHGDVRVDLGSDEEVTVEREARFDLSARSSAELQINLNAREWLSRAESGSRVVAESEFRSAVEIVAR